jgi:hypothetical protein
MNVPARAPFFAWPGWPQIRFSALQGFLVTGLFCLVFAGTDWFTAHRTLRVQVHFPAELHLPLIPGFTILYMSIYLLFLAAPFVFRTRREITTLAAAQTLTILVAGICFLVIPAKLAFPTPTDSELGVWKGLFRFADGLNLDYNLVPSLHVALSIVCIELFCVRANFGGKMFLRGWGVLIAAATLFTHQHHLVDAVTGYLLALGVVQCVQRAKLRIEPTDEPAIAISQETSPVI